MAELGQLPLDAVETALLGACVDPSLFSDAELRAAAFDDVRDQPLAWRGRFAITVRARTRCGEMIAVRAFRSGSGPREVYRTLETRHASLPRGLCRTRWIDDGLEVGGRRVPVVSMQWAPGRDLRTTALAASSSLLVSIARVWRQLFVDLSVVPLAHGDLQSDNVMVDLAPGHSPVIRLIDYDGAWLPGASFASLEAGHPAFEHPRRRLWGPYMDAFSSTLNYLAILALAADPALAAVANASEGVLFSPKDLASPTSALWISLAASPSGRVARLASLVLSWLSSTPDRYRSLEAVLRVVDSP
jgi:hypothetical protein